MEHYVSWPPPKRAMKYGFDGIIGVGKSRLTRGAKPALGKDKRITVMEEFAPELLLSLFYNDPKRYAFALQIYMLRSRQSVLYEFHQDSLFGRVPEEDLLLWDRTWLGDYVFMRTNVLNGNITESEAVVYEKLLGWNLEAKELLANCDVDRYVLMVGRPELSKYRLEYVRRNESEKAIPLSYYQQLDNMHYNVFVRQLMANLQIPVIVLPTERCGDIKAAWLEMLASADSTCKCTRVTEDDVPSESDDSAAIYDNPEVVRSVYKEYCAHENYFEKSAALGKAKDVYIRERMMCKDTNCKNVLDYETAYIQTVYAHLGRGDSVFLY